MSIDAARRHLAREFRAHGLDTPELDARLIIGHALGLDHASLVTRARCPLARDQAQAISLLAARRLAREPVARILGYKEFWGLALRLNADTLRAPTRDRNRRRGCTGGMSARARGDGASRISAPARAHSCSPRSPSCRMRTVSAPTSALPRSPAPALMPLRSACPAHRGSWLATTAARSAGPIRCPGVQSALCRARRHRGIAAGGARLRSAARARRRGRRP